MKAMILAAGRGSRMQPLTQNTPKPLLSIAGTPLIVHHLEALARTGIKEVIINTWYLGEQIVELIGGTRFGLKISYSPEDELLDTGGGITKCLPFFGADPFIVLSADVFTDFNFATLPKSPNGLAHLVMVENPSYHPKGDFGLDKGRLTLNSCAQTFTYANIGVFRPEFFAGAPQGPFPLRNLFVKHIADGNVYGQYFSGVWHNIGTPADLDLANSLYTAS